MPITSSQQSHPEKEETREATEQARQLRQQPQSEQFTERGEVTPDYNTLERITTPTNSSGCISAPRG